MGSSSVARGPGRRQDMWNKEVFVCIVYQLSFNPICMHYDRDHRYHAINALGALNFSMIHGIIIIRCCWQTVSIVFISGFFFVFFFFCHLVLEWHQQIDTRFSPVVHHHIVQFCMDFGYDQSLISY